MNSNGNITKSELYAVWGVEFVDNCSKDALKIRQKVCPDWEYEDEDIGLVPVDLILAVAIKKLLRSENEHSQFKD